MLEGDAMKTTVAVSLLGATLFSAPQPFNPDADGFIRNWLILAPIAIEGESGATGVDTAFLDGEATIKPKAGDTVVIGTKPLTWRPHQASDYFIDFLQAFPERGEYVAAYAVAYVLADEDMNVTLALSTNDQGKAWVNGKEVFKFAETRVLEKDTDRANVSLVKGQNILILKVVNEVNNWQGCARFLRDGAPVKNLRIALAPQ
jgi:hypothetical protein